MRSESAERAPNSPNELERIQLPNELRQFFFHFSFRLGQILEKKCLIFQLSKVGTSKDSEKKCKNSKNYIDEMILMSLSVPIQLVRRAARA